MKEKMIFLLRHGDKTTEGATREGELSLLGLEQGWYISRLIRKVHGYPVMQRAAILTSPVWRVKQLAIMAALMFGKNPLLPDAMEEIPELEWGPEIGNRHTAFLVDLILNHPANLVVVCGHDGCLQNIAQAIRPLENGYEIGRGEGVYFQIDEEEKVIDSARLVPETIR